MQLLYFITTVTSQVHSAGHGGVQCCTKRLVHSAIGYLSFVSEGSKAAVHLLFLQNKTDWKGLLSDYVHVLALPPLPPGCAIHVTGHGKTAHFAHNMIFQYKRF